MNAIARYWQTKAHSAIESGYSSAIQNYTAQKNNFLQELNIEAELAGEEFIEQINQEIQLELSSELDTTFNEAFSAVKDYFEKYIVSLISSGTSSYQELESKFQKLIRKSNEGKVVKGSIRIGALVKKKENTEEGQQIMGRKKKKQEIIKAKTPFAIEYKGDVSIDVIRKGKVIKSFKNHNDGTSNLFKFILDCLAGNYYEVNRPF